MTSYSERFAKARQIVELTANIALIAAVVVGLTIYVQRLHSPGTNMAAINAPGPQPSSVGMKVDLPGVDWKAHKATLVVAISSNCHYCVNSTPFYSQITHTASKTPIVVVMPQDQDEARSFLQRHSITPTKTVSSDLANIQVQATPTLLLVSPSGTVTRSWVGELSEVQRQQVVEALNQIL